MHDSKHRTTDTQIHDNRKNAGGYSSNKREWNSQTRGANEETSNHKKYMRTQSSSNNRVASTSSSQQNGEKKAVKDSKKPLRVSGDWSEFRSSTGKSYFYNCKTEVSQWEKPKGWPSDESKRANNSSTMTNNRIKKESTTETRHTQDSHVKSTSQYLNRQSNGISENQPLVQSNDQSSVVSNNRLPISDDDTSRMSFSSTSSSKESSSIPISANNPDETNCTTLHSSLSDPAVSVSTPICDIPSRHPANGNDNKKSVSQSLHPTTTTSESTSTIENESSTISASKAEREQDIQKYYRAELVQHLTDWSSGHTEKQCCKLFDDYYRYSTKLSAAFIELKALKSKFRVLEIKRNILTRRVLLCQKELQQTGEDKYS